MKRAIQHHKKGVPVDRRVMPELKPCPFCGGKAIYVRDHCDYVHCSKCDATGPGAHIVGGENKWVEAWNTRTSCHS